MSVKLLKRVIALMLSLCMTLSFQTAVFAQGSVSGQKEAAAGNLVNAFANFPQLPTNPAAALDIPGSEPNLRDGFQFTPGKAGYVKHTAMDTYNMCAYTTLNGGDIIEVYRDQACTSLVTRSEGDGGINHNMVKFRAERGTTYYIKIKAKDPNSSEAFLLQVHRGMPTGGYEYLDFFYKFNSNMYRDYTNCYTYALTLLADPRSGNRFRMGGMNPGEFAGSPIGMADISDEFKAKIKIEEGMTKDLKVLGGSWSVSSENEVPKLGCYKVALVLSRGVDYHWYRQLDNGKWGHKPGRFAATDKDAANNVIYYPNTCNRNYLSIGGTNYNAFIGWYQIQVPSYIPSNYGSRQAEKEYGINNNLTMDDIKKLTVNTSYDDAMQILGQAHAYRGSGMVGGDYELVDGTTVTVYFAGDHIDQIRTYHADGSYDILVQ